MPGKAGSRGGAAVISIGWWRPKGERDGQGMQVIRKKSKEKEGVSCMGADMCVCTHRCEDKEKHASAVQAEGLSTFIAKVVKCLHAGPHQPGNKGCKLCEKMGSAS